MTEVNAEIIKPFGPSILKVKIPKQIVDDLNQYVDNTIADKTKANQLDYGNQLIGDVTQEFKLEEDELDQREETAPQRAAMTSKMQHWQPSRRQAEISTVVTIHLPIGR